MVAGPLLLCLLYYCRSISPFFYYFNEVLSEGLFTFFITIFFALFWLGFLIITAERPYFASSIALTLAIYTRPVGMFLVYPMALLHLRLPMSRQKDV